MPGDFDRLEDLFSGSQNTKLVRGIVLASAAPATGFLVNVSGSVIPVSAADSASAAVGDSVLVALIDSGRGQAEAIVLCRMSTTGLHPATGTVKTVPPSSPTITVTGADGTDYTAYFLSSYTPAVSDNVEMTFLAGVPYVTKTGATPAPPPPAPVASSSTVTSSGTSNFAASDSSTWWGPGGWDSWDSGNYPSGVFSGDYGNGPLTGAWFYGGGPGQLAGRTINGGRITFGARLGVGSYNSPLAVNIYTHSATTRPGGNVSLLNGPASGAIAQPWQGLTTYILTPAMAADIVNGGGVAIQGGSYIGFQGIAQNAQSGTVSIDWSR